MRRLSVILLFPLLSSCGMIPILKKVHATDVDIVTFQSENKTVQFIPMAHIGKPEFYEKVNQLVDSFKADGYVIFHEGITDSKLDRKKADKIYSEVTKNVLARRYLKSSNKDSVAIEIYLRKIRKMFGGIPDSSKYMEFFKEVGMFKNMVDQPRYYELKTDEKDLKADVSLFDLVDDYERRFGTIDLTEFDFQLPLTPTESLPASRQLPSKKVEEVIIDFRDSYLADAILRSPHSRIVVIYGLAHLDGTFYYMQQSGKVWKKKKTVRY